jgi:hypothetical protein
MGTGHKLLENRKIDNRADFFFNRADFFAIGEQWTWVTVEKSTDEGTVALSSLTLRTIKPFPVKIVNFSKNWERSMFKVFNFFKKNEEVKLLNALNLKV